MAVFLFGIGNQEGNTFCSLLDKKVLGKSWDFLWDRVVVNVFDHLIDEFGRKLHSDGDVLDLKGQVADFNLVCVDGIL